MRTRLRNLLLLLGGQLWLVPILICLAALGLAYLLIEYGAALLADDSDDLWWVYSGDPGSAREVLSGLLTGMITMTSLVVSITFVILTLAASQLGPRVISTFIADRQIQMVLGLFLGTILYVLVVLRTLADDLGKEGVPHLAVTGGSALTVVCLFTLLLYLNKVAQAIIADNVVDRVARELHRDIRQILPEAGPSAPSSAATDAADGLRDVGFVALGRCGYVQAIDYRALVGLAQQKTLVLRTRVRAGHFVLRHGDHVAVRSAAPIDGDTTAAIRKAFSIGRERTPAQDLEYRIRHLVEIGLRAMSTGVNDPFTAMAVLERLGAAVEEILLRSLCPAAMTDETGTLRVLADRSDLAGLVDAAFDQLRQAGARHPAILICIADTLGSLAPASAGGEARRPLLAQLAKLEETAQRGALVCSDRQDVATRIAQARAALLS